MFRGFLKTASAAATFGRSPPIPSAALHGNLPMTIADELPALAPPLPRRALPYKWELMVLLWFAYFFNRADRQIYSFVMPQIQSDLKLSDFQLGLVATIFTWTYGLLVPFGGYLGDLLRRKWVIVISLLLW